MVIDYFHVLYFAVIPHKTNAPLLVDANAHLPSSVTVKTFQSITGRFA